MFDAARRVGVTIPDGQRADTSREYAPNTIIRIMDDARFIPVEVSNEYGRPHVTMAIVVGKDAYLVPNMDRWVATWTPLAERQKAQLFDHLRRMSGQEGGEVPTQDTVNVMPGAIDGKAEEAAE